MRVQTKILLVLLLVGILASQFAFAQEATPNKGLVSCGGTTQPACQLGDLVILIIRVINWFLGMSWILALFFIFWGSYNIAAAAGNEEKMKAGKTDFRNGIIGFFLIMAAFLLVDFTLIVFSGYTLDQEKTNCIYQFIPGLRCKP